MIKDPIRLKVSRYIKMRIPEGRWEQKIDELDTMGISRKQILTILILACQQIENLEMILEEYESTTPKSA